MNTEIIILDKIQSTSFDQTNDNHWYTYTRITERILINEQRGNLPLVRNIILLKDKDTLESIEDIEITINALSGPKIKSNIAFLRNNRDEFI